MTTHESSVASFRSTLMQRTLRMLWRLTAVALCCCAVNGISAAQVSQRPEDSFFEGQRSKDIALLRGVCNGADADYRALLRNALPVLFQIERSADTDLLIRIHGFIAAVYKGLGDEPHSKSYSDKAQQLFTQQAKASPVEDLIYTGLLLNYDLRIDTAASPACREIETDYDATKGQFVQALVELDDHIDDLLLSPRREAGVEKLKSDYKIAANQLMSAVQARDSARLRQTVNQLESILRQLSRQHVFPELYDKTVFDTSSAVVVAQGRLLTAFWLRDRRDYLLRARSLVQATKAFNTAVNR